MDVARVIRSLVVALLVAPAACAGGQGRPATAPSSYQRADTATLRRKLDSLAGAHHGVVGYSVRNLETGEHLERRGDETFPTASLIKVAILVTVFDLVERGEMRLDDQLTLMKIDKVSGSGELQYLHDNALLTVRDAAWLMITLSDNTATNLLLDRIIIRRVWDKMEKLGLPHTKVHSKTYLRNSSVAMDSSVKYGIGVSTPNEMARLFALLADGKAVSLSADSTMLDFLAHNQDHELLQRHVDGLEVPHKTGGTSQVRTECALFPLQSRVVACVFTKENVDQRWLIDSEPQVMMAAMGELVSRAWPRRPAPPASP